MAERFKATARIPVRPLSMANVDMAEICELLVDYDNHTMHMKASDGNIYDITGAANVNIEELLEEIKQWIINNASGDVNEYFEFILDLKLTVINDNGEEEIITLKEAITKLFTEINSIKIRIDNIDEKIENIQTVINKIVNEDGDITINAGDIVWDDEHQPVSKDEKERWDNKADIFPLIVIVPGGETMWSSTNDEAPYTQLIEVPEILETDYPVVDVMLSNVYDTANKEIAEYEKIYKIITYNGSIKLFAHSPTETSITIHMKVDR